MLAEGIFFHDDSNQTVRKLGATGPEVFPIALGCMGMSGMYGAADDASRSPPSMRPSTRA